MNIDSDYFFLGLYFIPIITSFILAAVFNNNWFLINAIPNITILSWAIFDKLELTPYYWKFKKEKELES